MNQYALTDSLTIETVSCGECGVIWGMPVAMLEERRADGKGFFCPNGHCRVYLKTTARKLQEQLDSKSKMLSDALSETNRIREQRNKAESQLKRFKTLLSKAKKEAK